MITKSLLIGEKKNSLFELIQKYTEENIDEYFITENIISLKIENEYKKIAFPKEEEELFLKSNNFELIKT